MEHQIFAINRIHLDVSDLRRLMNANTSMKNHVLDIKRMIIAAGIMITETIVRVAISACLQTINLY